MSVYTDNGYTDWWAYLQSLAADYGVSLATVIMLADANGGANEDFDGLVITLEDYAEQYDD